jgi:2-oxoglutarate ferredoxin oxidoreductase subunit alpha
LNAAQLEEWNINRYERYKIVERDEVMYEEFMMDDADYCVVAFGIAARIAKNAIMDARKKGIKVGMLRPITLYPFPKDALNKAADKVKAFLSVELNMGQMVDDVKLAIDCAKPVYFYGRTGGVLMTPDEVLGTLEKIEKGEAKQW